VVFVSAEYAARDWIRLERRAALARAARERREYVLPARFDDTQLPGLLPDVSYVDLAHKNSAAVRCHDRSQAGRLETAAVAELRALAAGRADLLAEVADILDGTPDGELD
jgi:hypothetical protein